MRDNTDIANKNLDHSNREQDHRDGKTTLFEPFPSHANPEVKEELESPYKGLNPYTEADTSIFFGRENDIQKIVNNLLAWRLTILYGKSGVGKSSVLRAGVTYTLNEEAQQNIDDYGVPKLAVVVFPSLEGHFSWKDNPLTGLRKQIEETIAASGWGIKHPEPGLSFIETLRGWTDELGGEDRDGELYLILDQFEEYSLYHAEETEENTFYTEFSRAVNCRDLRVNFLISIRDDSLADLDRFQSRIPNLLEHRLQIGHIDGQAAREAIINPIEYYNQYHGTTITIEPTLVDAVLDEVQVGKVVLGDSGLAGIDVKPKSPSEMQIETPYLQLVMERLWKEEVDQRSSLLRLETFNTLGQANKIVKDHLNYQMQLLTEEERQTAACIFQHLVTSSGAKYAYSVLDLSEYTKIDQTQLKQLLEKLASGKQRILRPVGLTKRNHPQTQRYEIFHDALAPAILDWRRRYLEHQKRAKELAEKLAKEVKQREQLKRRLTSLVVTAVLITILLVGSITGSRIWKLSRDLKVTEQRLIGIDAVQRADSSSQLMALQDAMQMVQTIQTQSLQPAVPMATLSLQKILSDIQEQNQFQASATRGFAANLAFLNPRGDLVATSTGDGTVSIWNLKGEKLIDFQAHDDMLIWLKFLEDGQRLATAAMDGTVATWTLNGQQLTEVQLPKEAGWVVNFSPDGQKLATVDSKGTVTVLTLEGKQVSEFHAHDGWVITVSFSPDGQKLATAGQDDAARLWDLKGNQLAELKGHQGAAYFVKFGPKGQRLVTGGQDGTIRVWNLEGKELKQFRQGTGAIYYLGISSDGERVATASADGVVRLLDNQGNQRAELRGHENVVTDVSFSQDGKHLVTATRNGTIRVWNLQDQRGFPAYTESIFRSQIRMNPDGQSLVTAAERVGISQWDLQGNRLGAKGGTILTSFLSKDGQLRFVEASQDLPKEVYIRDFQQNKTLAAFGVPGRMVWNAQVSPDQKWLFTTTWGTANDAKGQLWNIENPQDSPRELVHPNGARTAAGGFSADSQKLATGSRDGEVAIWDIATLSDQPLVSFEASEGSFITALEFSPNGQQLAITSWNNTAGLWDMQGKQLQKFEGHRASIQNVHFSPDGKWLLTSSLDGTARLWDLQGRQWAEYPGHGNSGILDAVFSPDGQQVATISLDGYVQLWFVEQFDQLVEKGCNWLTDYLAAHPEVQKQLTVCHPQ